MTKLTNREYTAMVEAGKYPDEPRVPIDPGFTNEVGVIENLLLEKFSSVASIISEAGAIRSNHYHKTDWHYMFVVSGTMHYYWKAAGSNDPVMLEVFEAGSLMFTPPMVIHATYFPKKTHIMTFAKNIRDHAGHEADLMRVKLIEKIMEIKVCE